MKKFTQFLSEKKKNVKLKSNDVKNISNVVDAAHSKYDKLSSEEKSKLMSWDKR
jgi:hypothetical protein